MADWAPVVVGVVLFMLLSPGLLVTVPGKTRFVELFSLQTSGKAIFIHTLLFFAIYTVIIILFHVHLYVGQ